MTDFLVSTWADSNSLTLYDLQLKTIALLCLATMARPRSDIGRLQFQDIIFNFEDSSNSTLTGVKIHFREPKETQVKTTSLGLLQDTRLCPVSTLYLFISKSNHLRANLPTDHTLFLAYIDKPEQVTSIRPSTMSSWVKLIMERSGVDTTIYKAHSIRSASSTKAVEKGHSIQAVKEHANWSLNSNTFEKFYYKPTTQDSSNTAITHSIFSQAENSITLGDGVEPTEIDLGTTNNPTVGETKSNNVIDAHP
jgi:integrase